MSRERDYAYEALAESTGTDLKEGRGALNAALKSIKEQSGIEDSYLLADEIHQRAKMYRQAMPDVILTPNALAKHWLRVYQEVEKKKATGVNIHAAATDCPTCGGDRIVEVGTMPEKRMDGRVVEFEITAPVPTATPPTRPSSAMTAPGSRSWTRRR